MISDSVGVVIIGRNEGERLVRCLSSIDFSEYSVVYVDSGSTDGSIGAARGRGAVVVNLDLTRPFTAGRARNEGFAALRALRPQLQYVQFIDGDCELVDGWMRAALSFMEQRKDVAVVCGRRRERSPDASVYNRLCDIEWNTPIGEASRCGGDSLMRVDAFAAAGGFQPTLMAGEEPELCSRLRADGWKIWRLDKEMTRHDAAMTRFGQWWMRAIRSGYGYADVAWSHRASPSYTYRREIFSTVFWGGILPALIVLGTFIDASALALVSIYPLQIGRIAFRRGPTLSDSWAYAWFMMLGKFAALYGLFKWAQARLANKSAASIEYK